MSSCAQKHQKLLLVLNEFLGEGVEDEQCALYVEVLRTEKCLGQMEGCK